MTKWMAGAGLAMLFGGAALAQPADVLQYAPDGRMLPPKDYRSWVYLSTGFDMAYTENANQVHVFDNVFVNREAYEGFLKTRLWPDKTVLVLEQRGAGGDDPVNKHGLFQSGEPTHAEVHVKDAARGGWAFYPVNKDGTPAAMIPKTAACYSCHEQHGQTDTGFTQFYPTLAAKPAK